MLRDHPLMSYGTMRNWPPVWIEKFADTPVALVGEIGILKHVGIHSARSKRCYLHIAYNDKAYVGSLLFDDPAFCTLVGELLKTQIHKSIRSIGDLDLAYTYNSAQ